MKILKFDIFKYLLYAIFLVFSLSLSNESLGVSDFFYNIKWPFLIAVFIFLALLFSFLSIASLNNVFACIIIFLIFQLMAAFVYKVDPLGTIGKVGLIIFCLLFGQLIGLILSKHDFEIGIIDIFIRSIFTVVLVSMLITSVGIIPMGGRFSGILNNANLMSGISVISFIYYACLFKEKKVLKYLTFCLLSLFCVFLTQSRGGLITFLISSILFLYHYGYFTNIKKSVVIFLALIFSLTLYLFLNVDFSYREINLDNRIDSFLSQLSAFFYSPFLGLGFGGGDHSKFIVLSESTYVSLLSSSGIFGTLSFMFLLIFLYLKQDRIKDKLVLASIYLISVSEAYLLGVGNPISLFFYLFIGVSTTSNFNKICENKF